MTFANRTALYPGLLIAIAIGYLLYPNDLIPDSSPYGLADDGFVCLFCFIAAARTAPPWLRSTARTAALFSLRVLHTDVSNFALLQHRYVDGFVISGKNSGSHWVKYMLSLALAERYGLQPPKFTSGREADVIVGRASRSRLGRGYPQIATSHTIPSILLAWVPLPRWIRQPPVVLLVRHIPDALQSNYRKWQPDYGVSLSEFVQGDPSGRRFIADIWWYVRFFNNWGAMHRRKPGRVLLVRYEDLLANPGSALRRIAAHLRLDVDESVLDSAVRLASKDRMRDLQDPNAGETIIPDKQPGPALSMADQSTIAAILRRYLRHDFGYGYAARPRANARHAEEAERAANGV